jgi:hypothetical protein
MYRFLCLSMLALIMALSQIGCSAGAAGEDCGVIAQSCMSDCNQNAAFSDADQFICQSNCANDAFICSDVANADAQNIPALLASDDRDIDDIDIEDIRAEDIGSGKINNPPPLTKEEWSYVSVAGMTLLAGGVTAVLWCGLNPVCLAAAAGTVGLASYKYKIILRGATLGNNGVITAVKGVASATFAAASNAALAVVNKVNPLSFKNPGTIDAYNQALVDALAKRYKLW